VKIAIMHLLHSCRFPISLFALLVAAYAQDKPGFTSPLSTGLRLDPVGDAVELGSLPINLVVAPGDKVVVVLSGWREQGIQVVDLKTARVTQTLLQDGAFYGAAFAPDGQHLYVSGGNTDMLFVYAWKDGAATLENKFVLAKAKTADGTGTSYPAGVAVAPNGKFIYVAENVGDHLAVVNAATGEIARVPHRVEMFLPTELRVLAMSHSLQSRKSLRRGGSNCVMLESPSNERWTGQRVDVRSIFVIRRAMLLSSLLQPFGVAVGDFDSLTGRTRRCSQPLAPVR